MKKYFFLVLTLAAIACTGRQPAKSAAPSEKTAGARSFAPACCLDHRSDIDKWNSHQASRIILSSAPSPTYLSK
jgi:hypothetical protein